jgi:hypothetical protein
MVSSTSAVTRASLNVDMTKDTSASVGGRPMTLVVCIG